MQPTQQSDHEHDILTAEETAAWLRVEIKTVRELASTKRIPSQKVGKAYRFSRAAVLDWLQGSKDRVALTR